MRFLPEAVGLIARREWRLLVRGRAAVLGLATLFAVAWMPALLVPLRSGHIGLADLPGAALLTLAIGGVTLPLLGLLAGADTFASEIEDGTLVPIVTLPISRSACFVGKCLGRAALATASYVAVFGSAGLAMGMAHGAVDAIDYLTVAAAGLLLLLASGGVGVALGAGARGRLGAFGLALIVWLGLVFVVDALLLAGVIVVSPAPPAEVGGHGHGELTMAMRDNEDPATETETSSEHDHSAAGAPAGSPAAAWWMASTPTDLHRLSGIAWSPGLRQRMGGALPSLARAGLAPVVVGWAFWLLAPPALGLWRFRRALLR